MVLTPALARQRRDGLHHRHRPDGVDRPHGRLGAGQQLRQGVGHQALAPVAAVIGGHQDLAAKARISCSRMTSSFVRPPMMAVTAVPLTDQCLGDGVYHGRADAPADADGVRAVLQVRRPAQRADDVGNGLARLHRGQQRRGLADALDDQADRPGLGVGVGDGQRDSLAPVGGADDDELPRAADGGDPRGLDFQSNDVFAQRRCGDDTMPKCDSYAARRPQAVGGRGAEGLHISGGWGHASLHHSPIAPATPEAPHTTVLSAPRAAEARRQPGSPFPQARSSHAWCIRSPIAIRCGQRRSAAEKSPPASAARTEAGSSANIRRASSAKP